MSDFTPGPWIVDEARDRPDYEAISVHEASAQRFVLADIWGDVKELRSQVRGNAHLIAAAPDMLAVLKRLAPAAADDSWTRPDSATREAILDVIAKAEGR